MKQELKFGDFLTIERDNKVDIIDSQKYIISGVQNYGQGVIIRREVFGKNLKMKKYQLIKENQLMWCKVDTKNGAFGITKEEHIGTITSTNMALANFDQNKVLPNFLETLFKLKPFHENITKLSSGTTNRKYLTPTQLFKTISIPKISEKEQKLLIDKIKYINSLGLSSKITNQQTLLKKLRQAILQEAIQGKLTADWRKENPNVEPASELLKRIQAEKEKLIVEKKIKPQKPLPPIKAEEIPFELPKGWVWCRLGDCTNIVRGGSPRPAGDKKFYDGSIPFLKVADLTNDNEMYVKGYTYTIKEAGLHKTRYVEEEILMLTNSGATLGIPKICNFPTTFNDGIAAFIYMNSDLSKPFWYYFLKSKTLWFLEEAARGQGQPNLNINIIGNTLVGLPTVVEQKAIVTKVEKLLAYCDELEQQIQQTKTYSEQLMQTVLKEAFTP